MRIISRKRPGLPKLNLERLYRTRSVRGARWSPDGQWICFSSNASGRQNIWIVKAKGGWPLQLTVSDQRQVLGAWSPDGRWIVFQSDYDGDEQWDLFAVSTENGDVRNLTNTREISEESPVFSPGGKRLAYVSKPKTSASYEVHVMEFGTGKVIEVTRETPSQFSNHDPVWSKDGRSLAWTQSRADQKADAIFVARGAGLRSVQPVSPENAEHNYYAVDWSPDARQLLITSNALNRFSNVAVLDIETRELEWITRAKYETDAGAWHGRTISYLTNRDGDCEISLYDTTRRRAAKLPWKPGLATLGSEVFAPDGGRLVFSYSGPGDPNDFYTYDLRRKKSLRITNSLLAGMNPRDMVQPYLVHYRSADGLRISAFLYVPYNLARNESNPAIVHVHGGPSAQTMNSFNRSVQYLVNNGYIVIAPNYRGSTGYGKDFEEKNRFDMGGGDLHDVVHAAGFLKTIGYVDPRRIALMGGSYGGYMTMMGLTHQPELWAAGVAIVPFVNWFTELEHEDPALREWDLATMGDPVENRKLYEERSPINFIGRIRAPLLVLAGGNDPRCPKEESEQIVEAVKRRGGVIEYQAYENEGHGFARVENAVDGFRRTVGFLDRWMR
ncbi:MAG: alpha/beta fold hydrolase [Bryobacteraceae bacterium]